MPVARAEQPADIMLPLGMSIVNVITSPDMVPVKAPGIRPCIPEPEKLMGPVTADPFCVSCHVMVPMSACPIMLPEVALLESDPLPAHAPATDPGVVGADGNGDELPPHAAANDTNNTAATASFAMLHLPLWIPR